MKKTSMKLVQILVVSVCMCLAFSIAQEQTAQQQTAQQQTTEAQEDTFSLKACDEQAQILSQSFEDDKFELEFTSTEKVPKCFADIDDQLEEKGWQRVKGNNNVYKSDFYRIGYVNASAEEATLILRQKDNAFAVMFEF